MAKRYCIFIQHGGEITNTDEGAQLCSQNPIPVTGCLSVTLLEL